MSDVILDFADKLRRYADECQRIHVPVHLTYDPVTVRAFADLIERGARRSHYVRTVQAEAERLRDAAEEMMMAAQDVNAAADRALERAEGHLRRARWASLAVIAIGLILAVLA